MYCLVNKISNLAQVAGVSKWMAFLAILAITFHIGKRAIRYFDEKRYRNFGISAVSCAVTEIFSFVLLLTHNMI